MSPRKNPLNLNALQLKTLTLFQELARIAPPSQVPIEPGHALIPAIPRPHGDHFHLGESIVQSRDATGLANESAWLALERKGLIKSMFPISCVLTPAGQAYETGLRDSILHRARH